jgi:hypothetical protein
MELQDQKRRVARIPVACTVGVRDRGTSFTTETVDVGARGCRISLENRPLSRGSLVQLLFDRGGGAQPLEVVGQVAWTRTAAPRAAGIVFVNLPRDPTGAHARNWIDALVAAQLRQLVARWPDANAALAKLGNVVVQLGIPPTEPLDHNEVQLIRLARDGVMLGHISRSAAAVRILVGLLDRDILSVARETPDPEGWKQAFSSFARTTSAAHAHRPTLATPAPAPAPKRV